MDITTTGMLRKGVKRFTGARIHRRKDSQEKGLTGERTHRRKDSQEKGLTGERRTHRRKDSQEKGLTGERTHRRQDSQEKGGCLVDKDMSGVSQEATGFNGKLK